MKIMCCIFTSDSGERSIMLLRAHLVPMDALHYCAQLGLPVTGGDFSCTAVPDELVELFAEHAERVLTEAKAQELFGDKMQELWPA